MIDIASGKVIQQVTTTPPIFTDEIWYNPGDEHVYSGSFVNTPVVNGLPPYNVIGTLPWTGAVPERVQLLRAADRVVNSSFVPVNNTGILVFTDETGSESDN